MTLSIIINVLLGIGWTITFAGAVFFFRDEGFGEIILVLGLFTTLGMYSFVWLLHHQGSHQVIMIAGMLIAATFSFFVAKLCAWLMATFVLGPIKYSFT